ncbi:protein sidekick-1 isoform X2 [Amblyraja radiata]|uniref:protein sidekick-1 isoform X2 n=1 Tax=Amblyraja radiata TaxID=386614 RepID=UPI001402AD36|nr:protein sidekick-1 isoform X2 [Amblyraja radiata]
MMGVASCELIDNRVNTVLVVDDDCPEIIDKSGAGTPGPGELIANSSRKRTPDSEATGHKLIVRSTTSVINHSKDRCQNIFVQGPVGTFHLRGIDERRSDSVRTRGMGIAKENGSTDSAINNQREIKQGPCLREVINNQVIGIPSDGGMDAPIMEPKSGKFKKTLGFACAGRNFNMFGCFGGLWTFVLFHIHVLQTLAQEDVPPYFKTEPGPPQVHLEGNRLVLTCLAEGSWPLEFKWFRNDTAITAFSREYRYVIPSLQRSDTGFYQCVVRNRRGALLQRKTQVHVAYLGNFEGGDQSITISQGQAAVLKSPNLSSYPQPQMTWFCDGQKIIPSNRIAITLDNHLVLLSVAGADAGRYYVQAVNEKNGENKTSAFIFLAILNTADRADPVAPRIVVAPKNTSIVAGTSEVTLECVANARPVDRLSITWKRNGVKLKSGISVFGRRLMILNPTSADIGKYECVATLQSSSVLPVHEHAYISIIEPPYFTEEPNRRILGEVEKTVDIPCRAMGIPVPSLQWYKDSVPVIMLNNSRYKVMVSGTLQIQGLVPEDSGIFQCFAGNEARDIQSASYLTVTNIAPFFIRAPSDTAVTDGAVAVLHCEASGAPKPGITWAKGDKVLASGSVQIPRFVLQESGGLLIKPAHVEDAATFTCFATNSMGAVNASAYLTVWTRTFISVSPEDRSVIKGTTAVLTCGATHDPRVTIRFVWKKDGKVIDASAVPRITTGKNGSLHISQTWSGDIGDYTCEVLSAGGNDFRSARLEVIELPHPPRNLQATLNATTSRAVDLSWTRPFDGNSRILHYIVELSENNSPWKIQLSNISPEVVHITVNGLTSARSYQFRMCAVNQLGKGQYSIETNRLLLPEEAPSAPPQNIMASGRTNQSIMVQWQPPPEQAINGVLKGYILRYRLAGLPGGYQFTNITNPEVTYCLIKDLIIWTQYEIQVAAYNSAGLGVRSRAVTEYTLQGVPTAMPQNVEVEAVNSTALRFTWDPPPQQFINGINQGYKLLTWIVDPPNTVKSMTIAPDFHGTRHEALLTGLKKFTKYYTSVLCFTTPGNGPKSPPKMIQTHEDRPGPVGHLRFTEILDTSLKVSWQEPQEKNGILTGYEVSWGVFNRNDSRLSRKLSSTTLEYKITGLTSLTIYTIEVAAMTAAGSGAMMISTISSGVPPELPGAPSNLVISNISPRSVTLQFQPGFDGKTSISKWIVEGQIEMTGEDEEWVLLYEVANEPNVQVLDVPNLIPYTYYRFRIKQINIVGSSPVSWPSRVIQTLQAPPDVAPASITVRTASETSVWVRWVPLPETEYNGNPDSVGYRMKYWRVDGQGMPATQIVNDRLEREITIENLEEWTDYLFHIQAFNAIGSGPWSSQVQGCTRESVPSAAPGNVTAEAVSPTQILVMWGPVPESDQNGLILGYKILYREKDSESGTQTRLIKGNFTHSVVLNGLRKYNQYEIQVLAFTRIGDGVPCLPVLLERTKDDVPGPPIKLIFPEVQMTSVRVVWQTPENPNGIILGYRIAYCLATTESNKFITIEVSSNARQYSATNLIPESPYVFRVSARTRRGWGDSVEAMVITTQTRDRPQPISNLTVPQSEIGGRSLLLHWTPGNDRSSPVRYFTVQTKELPGLEWQTHTSSINHDATSYVIERLKPYTTYQLRMMATNDMGDSAFSDETEPVTTLQDLPSEAPVIVSVIPRTTTSVLVQWQPPKEESLNGILLGFRIYYRELTYENVPGFSTQHVGDSSAVQTELTHLKKYTRYEILMKAFNVVGESPASSPKEVYVGEAVPTRGPQDVKIRALTATQLEVAWNPPPSEAQNGKIQGYKIYYWERENQNDTEKVRVLFLPENTIRLKHLMSYTMYVVSVMAFNAAGDGPRSQPAEGRTEQAAPSAPSFITFTEVTTTTLKVLWGEPAMPNGVLNGYRLVYEPLESVQGVSKVVTVDLRGNNQRWLKVRDLFKGVPYCFHVQAKTYSFGPEIKANVTPGPEEGSPGPPLNPSISETSAVVTIHWARGVPGDGPIKGYVIEARPSDEGLWDTFEKDIPSDAISHMVKRDKLKQGVSYEFRVIAVNQFGYGEPSTPSIVRSAQLGNPPFYEEWWFLIVMALCSIILILLMVFGLILHGQNKKYKNTNGKHNSTVEETLTLDNGGFTALELNSRHLTVKSNFCKKNGTRFPPRPSPGALRYSDEDLCNNYNGIVLTESTTLTEKPTEISESEASDSDCEAELPKSTHSFVNHYMSDPTYFNSWKRQPKGLPRASAYTYEECTDGEQEPYYPTVITTQSSGGAYVPSGQPASGSRTPVTGFSSFV